MLGRQKPQRPVTLGSYSRAKSWCGPGGKLGSFSCLLCPSLTWSMYCCSLARGIVQTLI